MIIIKEEKSVIEDSTLFRNYGVSPYNKINSTKIYLGKLIDGRPLYQISTFKLITIKNLNKNVLEKCIQYCTTNK